MLKLNVKNVSQESDWFWLFGSERHHNLLHQEDFLVTFPSFIGLLTVNEGFQGESGQISYQITDSSLGNSENSYHENNVLAGPFRMFGITTYRRHPNNKLNILCGQNFRNVSLPTSATTIRLNE